MLTETQITLFEQYVRDCSASIRDQELLKTKANLYTYHSSDHEAPDYAKTIELIDVQEAVLRNEAGPCILLMHGEFGMGKSSILLKSALNSLTDQKRATVIPFVLRRNQSPSNELSWESLTNLLPEQIGIDSETLKGQVRNGSVILGLDGLDEVIDASGLNSWVTSLRDFLNDAGDFAKCTVVITVRSELLRVAGLGGFRDLANLFALRADANSQKRMTLYGIELDGFSEKTARRFVNNFFEKYKLESDLDAELETFDVKYICRPILAWIFCQYKKISKDDSWDKTNTFLTDLLDRYVEAASTEQQHLDSEIAGELLDARESKEVRPQAIWSVERIAKVALDQFEDSGGLASDFGYSTLETILNEDISRKLHENVDKFGWLKTYFIHKCPFFLRTPETSAKSSGGKNIGDFHFVHRIFLEYFTARGVWFAEDSWDYENKIFNPFDDLVLNVDMRKFLREMTAKSDNRQKNFKRWFRRTQRAYVLDLEPGKNDCPEYEEIVAKWRPEWKKEWTKSSKENCPCEKSLEELDYNRCLILAMMTYPHPEKDADKLEHEIDVIDDIFKEIRRDSDKPSVGRIENAIDVFLQQTLAKQWMHPRYLVPNLEPIYQYLQHHKNNEKAQSRRKTFFKVLSICFAQGVQGIRELVGEKKCDELAFANGMLLERCLSIGERLKLPTSRQWIKDEAVAQFVKPVNDSFKMDDDSFKMDDDSFKMDDRTSHLAARISQIVKRIGG